MGHRLRKRPQCKLSPDDPGWVAITENHELLKILMQRAGAASLVASILDEEATSERMPLLFQSKRGAPRQRVTRQFLNETQIGTMHVDAPSYFEGDQGQWQPRVLVLGLRPRPHPETIARAPLDWAVIFERQSAATKTLFAMRGLVVFAPEAYLDWLFPPLAPRSDESPRRTRTQPLSGSNDLTIKQIEDAIEFAADTYNSDPKRWKSRTTLAKYVTTEHLNWPENKWQTVDRHVTEPLFREPALRRKLTRSSPRK